MDSSAKIATAALLKGPDARSSASKTSETVIHISLQASVCPLRIIMRGHSELWCWAARMAGKAQSGRDGELVAFGQAVRRRRTDAGLSMTEMSNASGVSRRMLQGIEQGERNPGLRSILEIAAALGVTAGELISEAEVDPSG